MTNLMDDLRAADPVRHATPDHAAASRMDAALSALLADAPAPQRSRNRPRRLGVSLATATAAAGAVALALTLGADEGSIRPAPASASVVLAQLASAGAAAPAESGRYAYRKTIEYSTHMRPQADGSGYFAVVLPHENEQWLDADGNGVTGDRIREDQPSFPTPQDRAEYEAASKLPPQIDVGRVQVQHMRIAGLDAEEIQALPTDPLALRRAIRTGMRRAGVKADNAVLAAASQLLSSALTPPDVRGAIFELLRREPGAQVTDDVQDPLGRTGVAITFDSAAWKTTLLFDRADGRLLATRSIGRKELPGREIQDWSVVVETGRRETAPDAPTLREWQRRTSAPTLREQKRRSP